MKNKMKMTDKELESLEEVLEYLSDEEESLEEYLQEGGRKRDHICYHIDKLWRLVSKQKALQL